MSGSSGRHATLVQRARAQWAAAVLALVAFSIAAVFGYSRLSSSRRQQFQRRPVVAVAPFQTIGSAVEPWSGIGLQYEIEHALAPMQAVRVPSSITPSALERTVSRTSSRRDERRVASIGRGVGADYVIDGTVGRQADRSEIGVRLIRVTDASIRWTGTYWLNAREQSTFSTHLATTVVDVVRTEWNPVTARPVGPRP